MMKYFCFLCCLLTVACTRTEIPFGNVENCDPNISYNENVSEIINKSCAYVGCHVNNTAPGNYNSYEGMIANLNNGEFLTRVLSIKDMPPSYAPEGKPKELTTEELELITCWAENDYPQ
jgi:hypothetical protein